MWPKGLDLGHCRVLLLVLAGLNSLLVVAELNSIHDSEQPHGTERMQDLGKARKGNERIGWLFQVAVTGF